MPELSVSGQAGGQAVAESCLGAREAFDALSLARGGMLTMSSLYVTGVGITFAVWAAVEDADFRRGLIVLASVFMIVNFFAFRTNLKYQHAHFRYLSGAVDASDSARSIVDAMKPTPVSSFYFAYFALSAVVVGFGLIAADSGLQGIGEHLGKAVFFPSSPAAMV